MLIIASAIVALVGSGVAHTRAQDLQGGSSVGTDAAGPADSQPVAGVDTQASPPSATTAPEVDAGNSGATATAEPPTLGESEPGSGNAAALPVSAPSVPHDLSPWGMFMAADLVVKTVMIGLVLASVVTWTVWLAKTAEIAAVKRRMRKHMQRLDDSNSLAEAIHHVDSKSGAVPALLRAAVAETRASWDIADKHSIKERISARLDRVEFAAGRDINRGTGILATIGSTAPFIGLFGTVWGIMDSFIGISQAQTTNLAIVAPGIAEALLATAFGLIAAIPAVIVYNHFVRAIGGYKALVGDASVAVVGLASRDFDRGVRPELRAAE